MDLSNLKKLRCEKGLLQKDIAEYLGVTIASSSLYENSKRTPTFDILKKLCEFYDVDMELLLGWRDPRQSHIVYDNNGISNTLDCKQLPLDELGLLQDYRILNDNGKDEARKRVNELTEIPKYQKKDE